MVMLMDRAPLERVRKLADGRIAAVARFARSGVYTYTGAEVGKPHLATVNVYRPESEVFDQAAMASFAHKAITVGHPAQAVTADNWKYHSAGWTEGKIARDGEYLEIPLMLADATAVRAYESGEARELSAGYDCDLVWGDGVAPDGTRFQAKQTRIRGNHIAQVPAGRAGSRCRIGDGASADGTSIMNDAQLTEFKNSAAGHHAIGMAIRDHALKTRYSKGDVPFTDDMLNHALRAAMASKAKGGTPAMFGSPGWVDASAPQMRAKPIHR